MFIVQFKIIELKPQLYTVSIPYFKKNKIPTYLRSYIIECTFRLGTEENVKYFSFLSRNDKIDAGCMLLLYYLYGSVILPRLSHHSTHIKYFIVN